MPDRNSLIGKGPAIFKLFPGEDKTLLIRRNSFLVLDLRLDIVNRVRGFNLEGDRFAGQGLDEYLHASTKAQDEMKRGFLLDVAMGDVNVTTRQTYGTAY
jgi:hypothetical protein